jgi:HTH-type transcriptional regulator/antitoxin HigA
MGTPALDFRKPHVLRNDKEYRTAVREIDALLDADPAPGTEAYDRLEFLSVLVAAYEDQHEPAMPQAAPQDVVLFALEQQGKTRADLVPLLGSRSLVSDFLNGKRELSLNQIRRLVGELRIPAELLLKLTALSERTVRRRRSES